VGDAQTPPTVSSQALDTWLQSGQYKSWHCETAAHTPRDPSPHKDQNRICSNDLLSAAGANEYPVGAANVKELIRNGQVVGHAVYVKDAPGKTGDTFFWYETVDGSVAVMGHGNTGAPKSICVDCHSNAGPAHFGHDFVFTQVK